MPDKKIVAISFVVCILLCSSSVLLVGASSIWDHKYGGERSDVARSIVNTSDGGFAIAGDSSSFGAGSSDIWLVKTDANGTMQWNQTYGGTEQDTGYSLVATSDGGYAIAGNTHSFGMGDVDFFLVKTDSLGNVQWSNTYGGSGMDSTPSLVETPDGGFAMAGFVYPYHLNGTNILFVKTDELGNVEWSREYGEQGVSEKAHALIVTSDGGYAIAGDKQGKGVTDIWLIKLDGSGNIMWDYTYGSHEWYDYSASLVETPDGGYAVVGNTVFSVEEKPNVKLIKTDSLGNLEFTQRYGGRGEDWVHSIVLSPNGGYTIVGYTWSFGNGDNDIWLIKTDTDGNMEWDQTYGYSGMDSALSVVVSPDGCYVVAGVTDSAVLEYYDWWLLKINENGTSSKPVSPVMPDNETEIPDDDPEMPDVNSFNTTDASALDVYSMSTLATDESNMISNPTETIALIFFTLSLTTITIVFKIILKRQKQ